MRRRRHGRHPRHHHHGRRGPRGSLRKLLFGWFLVSLAATAFAATMTYRAIDDGEWRDHMGGVERFVATRWSRVWDDPTAREELARDFERELPVTVRLLDADGHVLREAAECESRPMEMRVRAEGGRSVGTAVMCMLHSGPPALQIGVALLVALAVLLFMSGMLAYRISAPIRRVAAVAQRLADGDLDARVGSMRARGEVSVLATVFDRMADRIGQQLDEQKQLLAHVSHELRTPLGHLRLLVGIGREGQPIDLDELERELEELEELVAQLLARSRVDLGIVQRRQVDVLGLGRRALERQGIDPAKMSSSEDELAYSLDPSLIERALANLVRNAQTHGGGLTRLSIESQDGTLVLEICDQGPGNETDGAGRGLGLGLPLARAIAEAHGGRLEQDHEGGGYRVRLVLGPGPLASA